MCGIAGVVSNDKSKSRSFLNSALIELNLRGPDDSGIYEDNLVSLGMTRLEILDPIGGKQPMTHSNRHVLVYNGQIYNHLDLRTKLPNYEWKSHSDTETLLVLLVNFGTDILSELNGMFSFAFWDKEKLELILARDGSGEKPLYYAIENQTLWFASTADALKKSISHKLEINYEAVSVMLNTGFIPPSMSVYKNVTQLMAGNYLLYKGHHLSIINFVSPSQITTTSGTSGDFLDVLNTVVDKQSTADVKVGLFLSGGLDSSLLAHILHNQKGKFDSFTAKLLNNSADIQAANIVAKKLGLNHHEVDIQDGDINQLLTKQAKFFDEPFGDSAAIPLIAISEIAKSQVGVCLSGDGADELFAGYGWKFRPLIESRSISEKIIPRNVNRAISLFLRKISRADQAQNFSDLANKQFYIKTKKDLFSAYLSRNYINQNFIHPDWSMIIDYEAKLANYKSSTLEKILEFERMFYLNGDILVKTDRATMGCSLEARTPYLDPMVIRYANSLNVDSKINWQTSKIVIRKAYKDITKNDYISRSKLGLGGPVSHWLNIVDIKNRIAGLQNSLFASSINEVFGYEIIKKSRNSSPQFEWNYLNLLLWAEIRGING